MLTEKYVLVPAEKALATLMNNYFVNVTGDLDLKRDDSKATLVGYILVEMLKFTVDIHVFLLTKIINSFIQNGCFPDKLKSAEVITIFKKNDDLEKKNYRPVCALLHVSKFFEKIMYIQTANFLEDKLSKLLTGFRENHST